MRHNLQNMLIVDLELTCWEDKDFQEANSEIIEIGVAEVSFVDKKIIRSKSYLIKPLKSKISPYCEKLTGITQELVDTSGVRLERASKLIRKDFGPKHKAWGGWGDDNQAIKDAFEGKINPFNDNYLNVAQVYSFIKGEGKKYSLLHALENEEICFEGSHHRAEPDAINTAKLILKVFSKL